MLEHPISVGLHPVEGDHAGTFCEEMFPMRATPRWSRGRA